jgi:hypothetical protein
MKITVRYSLSDKQKQRDFEPPDQHYLKYPRKLFRMNKFLKSSNGDDE